MNLKPLILLMAATLIMACPTPQDPKPPVTPDITAPGEVSSLVGVWSSGNLTLTWNDPVDGDLDSIIVTRTGTLGETVAKGVKTITYNAFGGSLIKVQTTDISGNVSIGIIYDALPPGNVSTLSGTPGNTTADLGWTNPGDADFKEIVITSSPVTTTKTVTKPGTSVQFTGLTNGQAYVFTVKSRDNNGNLSVGVEITVTPSGAPDTTPPGPVTSLSILEGNTQVQLNWQDPTDSDFKEVVITTAPVTVTTIVAKGLKTATLTGLANDTLYTFNLKTRDNTGNTRAVGETITGTPHLTADVIPPGPVTSLTATPGQAQATLNWSDPIDSDLKEIVLTWTGHPAEVTVAKGTQTYIATGLTTGVTTTFTVKTRDLTGNTSTPGTTKDVVAVDTLAPVPGTAISFTGTTSTGTTVQWGAATDTVIAQGQLQYKLVRSTASTLIDTVAEVDAITNVDRIQDWTTADLSETLSGLTASTTYWFAALVKDGSGNMALYTPASVTTQSGTDTNLVASSVVSPANNASNVNPLTLAVSIRFNKSLNTSIKGYLEYDHVPRIYKESPSKFTPGTMTKLEEAATITFSTGSVANDTVTFTFLNGYGMQIYANPKIGGFQPASGLGMTGPTALTHTFTTTHIGVTDTLGSEQWNDQNIYFMLTDRFNNATTANDQYIMTGDSDHVASDGKTYQGGDFAGITAKLDYLDNLGITTIWITAPVMQAWENATYTSYHGYWAQDFLAVDPHLGTMKDFRDLVSAAHTRGIKVIMDVVVNHTASLFNYPGEAAPWSPAFNAGGTYAGGWLTASWATNANRKQPYFGDIGATDIWTMFTRKGGNAASGTTDDAIIKQGDFDGLKDVNTQNATVRTKLKDAFKWWIANTNVDGFRIDTVKHVEDAFWTDFCGSIREWTKTTFDKDFYMVAEVYEGRPTVLGSYTTNSKLDSVLGFQFAEEVFDWNGKDNITVFKGSWASRPKTVVMENGAGDTAEYIKAHSATTTEPTFTTTHTNGDGLTVRQKIGYFIDNHDLNRFLNDATSTANATPSAGEIADLRLALGWLYTWEGIPVLYYGTEQNYKQSLTLAAGGEMGTGVGNVNKGNRPNLWQVANSSQGSTAWNQNHDTFKWIAGLNQLRNTYQELRRGVSTIRWTDDGTGSTGDDGILAYIRKGSTASVDDDIAVVINTNPNQASSPNASVGNDMGTDWPIGTVLQVVPIPGFEASTSTVYNGSAWVTEVTTYVQAGKTSAVWFQVPANTIRILKKKP